MPSLERDVGIFLQHFDALVDRLRPQRRPRDAAVPECSPRELRALAAIGRHGRLTMSRLADVLDVPLSTATRTVDRLAAKGLVERRQAKHDRRIIEVAFSRRGKRIHQYVLESRQAESHALLAALSGAERAELLRHLGRIVVETPPQRSD
jgi:DNA-binding MarR family transcriptional regulator